MRDKWNQDFFWTLENGTWIQKERMLILDSDGTTVFTLISGSTSGTTSGSTS